MDVDRIFKMKVNSSVGEGNIIMISLVGIVLSYGCCNIFRISVVAACSCLLLAIEILAPLCYVKLYQAL